MHLNNHQLPVVDAFCGGRKVCKIHFIYIVDFQCKCHIENPQLSITRSDFCSLPFSFSHSLNNEYCMDCLPIRAVFLSSFIIATNSLYSCLCLLLSMLHNILYTSASYQEQSRNYHWLQVEIVLEAI